ncbi:MAG: hypothetical protein ABIR33_14740 [Pyrinomonadaceae bacterium]
MQIHELIDLARGWGLSEFDLNNAFEALEHNEFGVGLDIVLVHLFERNVGVDDTFILKAREACSGMEIEWDQYKFVEALAMRD